MIGGYSIKFKPVELRLFEESLLRKLYKTQKKEVPK